MTRHDEPAEGDVAGVAEVLAWDDPTLEACEAALCPCGHQTLDHAWHGCEECACGRSAIHALLASDSSRSGATRRCSAAAVGSRKEWIKPKPDPLACYDCLLPYGEPGWCDAHIPLDAWLQISPTGGVGGVLCITCMARRLVALGIDNVPLHIGSGPWDFDTATERIRVEASDQGRAQGWDVGASEGLRTPAHLGYMLVNPYRATERAQ